MNLPGRVPQGLVLTAATPTRGSLTSTNEAKDIVPEVEIGMANPGKKCISTLDFHPPWSFWGELICSKALFLMACQVVDCFILCCFKVHKPI